jgi:hypothetical protein
MKFRKLTQTISSNKGAIFVLILISATSIVWKDEMTWYAAYHHAYLFDSTYHTINAYINCQNHKHDPLLNINTPTQSWDSVISNYKESSHDGWVISQHPVSLGLCNRILDTVSLLLLAIATNRTLWVEWTAQNDSVVNSEGVLATSDYDELFHSPIHNHSHRPSADVLDQAVSIDNSCFLHDMASSPNMYPGIAAITHTGCDWWGGLLLKNIHYKESVFKGLNYSVGFPILFRLLFNLKTPPPPPVECSWLIQYRTQLGHPKWILNPIDQFIDCAISRGMTYKDYKTTWIVTDSVDSLLEHASPLSKRIVSHMNLPEERKSCRGPCGDRQTMESMYRLSQCKHAVLTFGSSFGSCITSLATTPDIYRVGRYGDCHRLPTDQPYDMNTVSRLGNTATYLALST